MSFRYLFPRVIKNRTVGGMIQFFFTIISSQAKQENRNFKTANKLKRPVLRLLYTYI